MVTYIFYCFKFELQLTKCLTLYSEIALVTVIRFMTYLMAGQKGSSNVNLDRPPETGMHIYTLHQSTTTRYTNIN